MASLPPSNSDERNACRSMEHGFHIRHPPPPHKLTNFITDDEDLFQTIHMGKPTIDPDLWMLKIDGLVEKPFSLTLAELRNLPSVKVTSFHECYGSPLKPPTENVWRIGNVVWTGVQLPTLLSRAKPLAEAKYVWSDGLDYGKFSTMEADRYQKDLPIAKALEAEVLIAYEINGRPLDKERGGPVRLIVPGWFGTNSTKWLCRLRLEGKRSSGPFCTTFYNELVPGDHTGAMRPVWQVEPNSIIVRPEPGAVVRCDTNNKMHIWGWAWSHDGIKSVGISLNGGRSWLETDVTARREFAWQKFEIRLLNLVAGRLDIMATATSVSGVRQPLAGRRNHVHTVSIDVD